jgi:pimeloyl-ACP methyl ester carboxylesterase
MPEKAAFFHFYSTFCLIPREISGLKKFDFPTLVLHGDDDQIVPVKDSAKKAAKLVRGAKEIYYPGAPHGLTATHQDQVNAYLLTFIKGAAKAAA